MLPDGFRHGGCAGSVSVVEHDQLEVGRVTQAKLVPACQGLGRLAGFGGALAGTRLTSVDPAGELARAIPAKHIVGCVVHAGCSVQEPGLICHHFGNGLILGEPSGEKTGRVYQLAALLQKAGFDATVSEQIQNDIWFKLWGNLTFNPLSALTHATLEDICRFPPTRALAAAMMTEARTVAEALGVRFKISLDQRIAGAEAVGAHKTSMLQDVEAGRALELEALVGSVVELGRITDTPTPTIAAIYAATRLLGHTLGRQRGRLQVQAA